MTRQEILDYIAEEARARGIDPVAAQNVARWEGLNARDGQAGAFQSDVGRNSGNREPSFGVFQLHERGVGATFARDTGFGLRDPSDAAERARISYALDHVARQGSWAGWYGVRDNGYPNSYGIISPTPLGANAVVAAAATGSPAAAAPRSLASYAPVDMIAFNLSQIALPQDLPPVPASVQRTSAEPFYPSPNNYSDLWAGVVPWGDLPDHWRDALPGQAAYETWATREREERGNTLTAADLNIPWSPPDIMVDPFGTFVENPNIEILTNVTRNGGGLPQADAAMTASANAAPAFAGSSPSMADFGARFGDVPGSDLLALPSSFDDMSFRGDAPDINLGGFPMFSDPAPYQDYAGVPSPAQVSYSPGFAAYEPSFDRDPSPMTAMSVGLPDGGFRGSSPSANDFSSRFGDLPGAVSPMDYALSSFPDFLERSTSTAAAPPVPIYQASPPKTEAPRSASPASASKAAPTQAKASTLGGIGKAINTPAGRAAAGFLMGGLPGAIVGGLSGLAAQGGGIGGMFDGFGNSAVDITGPGFSNVETHGASFDPIGGGSPVGYTTSRETGTDREVSHYTMGGNDFSFYQDDPLSSPVGGSGSGGGAATVLCTHYMKKGWLSKELWRADAAFAKTLPRKVHRTYLRWAIPAVRKMQAGDRRLEILLYPVVRAWAQWAGYRMGVVKRFPVIGWAVHHIGVRIQAALVAPLPSASRASPFNFTGA